MLANASLTNASEGNEMKREPSTNEELKPEQTTNEKGKRFLAPLVPYFLLLNMFLFYCLLKLQYNNIVNTIIFSAPHGAQGHKYSTVPSSSSDVANRPAWGSCLGPPAEYNTTQ